MAEKALEADLQLADVVAGKVRCKVVLHEWAAAHGAIDAARAAVLARSPDYDPRKLNLSQTGLSERTVNMLEGRGISTLGLLADTGDDDLLSIPGFATATLRQVRMTKEAYGLCGVAVDDA